MAEEYQTPPITVAASIEAPTPITSGSGPQSVHATREPQRTWERQLVLDFTTIHREVTKSIKAKAVGEKWSIKSAEERRCFIEEEVFRELRRRERSNTTTTTVRVDHPDRWQTEGREVMDKWISRLENAPIVVPGFASNHGADRDDEETSLPGIKREFQDDRDDSRNKPIPYKRMCKPKYDTPSDEESSDSDSDNEDDEETEYACVRGASKKPCRGKAREAPKSVACSRGLGMILGSCGSKSVEVRVSKPAWMWKNGCLFVWPAIAGMPVDD